MTTFAETLAEHVNQRGVEVWRGTEQRGERPASDQQVTVFDIGTVSVKSPVIPDVIVYLRDGRAYAVDGAWCLEALLRHAAGLEIES